MFENFKFELHNKQIYLYSAGIILCLGSIFGVIFLASAGTEQLEASLPSPTPTEFAAVLGAQTQNTQNQQPEISNQAVSVGPDQPQSKPSILPSPSATPSPSPSLLPSSSPAPSPSPSPSPTSTPNPSPSSDTTGPQISEIKPSNITSNKVNVDWKTNEDADEKVEYGKDTSYGQSKDNSEKRTTHSVEIAGLDANTTYHYRITSKDNSGNSTVSGDNTFTTLP